MWLMRCNFLVMIVVIAGCFTGQAIGAEPLPQRPLRGGRADRVGRYPLREQPVVECPWMSALVREVDPVQETITIAFGARGDVEEHTFDLPRDAQITLSTPTSREGDLSHLAAGASVLAQLSADRTAVQAVRVLAGPVLDGTVRRVDKAAKQLTVTVPHDGMMLDWALDYTSDSALLLGGNRARFPAGQEGSIETLAEGGRVVVRLAADGHTIVSLTAMPNTVPGTLQSLDAQAGTLVLSTRRTGAMIDETFQLPKDVHVYVLEGRFAQDAALASLETGKPVVLQFSSFGKGQLIAVLARKK